MTWKIERWLTEVFPGREAIYSKYSGLSPRELAIIAPAVLDLALAELLSLRLRDYESEVQAFLGANGDGRAPAGSFGARIQLALLVGLLWPEDAALLRTIKAIRNVFAHRVNVEFVSSSVIPLTTRLHALWIERAEGLVKAGAMAALPSELEGLRSHLSTAEEAGQGLLLGVFTVYQAYFHLMHNRVARIGYALTRSKE